MRGLQASHGQRLAEVLEELEELRSGLGQTARERDDALAEVDALQVCRSGARTGAVDVDG
jgi:hypothetical protein